MKYLLSSARNMARLLYTEVIANDYESESPMMPTSERQDHGHEAPAEGKNDKSSRGHPTRGEMTPLNEGSGVENKRSSEGWEAGRRERSDGEEFGRGEVSRGGRGRATSVVGAEGESLMPVG